MKTITAGMLWRKRACPGQRALFKRVFPHGAPVTAEEMQQARKAGLQISWLTALLPDQGAKLLVVCRRQTRALRKEEGRCYAAYVAAADRPGACAEVDTLTEYQVWRSAYLEWYHAWEAALGRAVLSALQKLPEAK